MPGGRSGCIKHFNTASALGNGRVGGADDVRGAGEWAAGVSVGLAMVFAAKAHITR